MNGSPLLMKRYCCREYGGDMPVSNSSDTFVMDCGAYTIKAGLSSQSSPRSIPPLIILGSVAEP